MSTPLLVAIRALDGGPQAWSVQELESIGLTDAGLDTEAFHPFYLRWDGEVLVLSYADAFMMTTTAPVAPANANMCRVNFEAFNTLPENNCYGILGIARADDVALLTPVVYVSSDKNRVLQHTIADQDNNRTTTVNSWFYNYQDFRYPATFGEAQYLWLRTNFNVTTSKVVTIESTASQRINSGGGLIAGKIPWPEELSTRIYDKDFFCEQFSGPQELNKLHIELLNREGFEVDFNGVGYLSGTIQVWFE